MKKPRIAFCVADINNRKYYEMMKNSLRKFHTDEELPLMLIEEFNIKRFRDPDFFYRATPLVADELISEYETVIKIDADSIITGPLNAIWEGDFDVAVVNNSNPREMKTYPVSVLNIHPLAYVNAGFVVMKSPEFITFWKNFCMSTLFYSFQMREQDILNILVHSGNYKVKRLDEGDSYYGLASKQYWPQIELEGDKLILRKNDEWPKESDKYIKVIHFAGGNSPDKMNYRIRFSPNVIKYLDNLFK